MGLFPSMVSHTLEVTPSPCTGDTGTTMCPEGLCLDMLCASPCSDKGRAVSSYPSQPRAPTVAPCFGVFCHSLMEDSSWQTNPLSRQLETCSLLPPLYPTSSVLLWGCVGAHYWIIFGWWFLFHEATLGEGTCWTHPK